MKKLSIYTLLCCLAAACTFSLNSCQEFNIDSQTEFSPKIEIDAQAEYAVLAKAPQYPMGRIKKCLVIVFVNRFLSYKRLYTATG